MSKIKVIRLVYNNKRRIWAEEPVSGSFLCDGDVSDATDSGLGSADQ